MSETLTDVIELLSLLPEEFLRPYAEHYYKKHYMGLGSAGLDSLLEDTALSINQHGAEYTLDNLQASRRASRDETTLLLAEAARYARWNTHSASGDKVRKVAHNAAKGKMEQKSTQQQVELLSKVFQGATKEIRDAFVARLPQSDREALKQAVELAEENSYRELIFGENEPTIALFNDWLASKKGAKDSNKMKETYASAVNYNKTSMKATLWHEVSEGEWQKCTLITDSTGPNTISYRLLSADSEQRRLYGKVAFPTLKVRKK